MTNSNESKPEWRPGDSRMADFMHQASQILAAERGWNDRSKMLIRSLADDLSLPQYQYDDAVDQLQHGKLDFEDRFSTYEKAFIKYLTRQFEKSQIGVLTAAHETTAIRKARREFEIGQSRARHLIRHVAEQMNISRVSKQDAVEYVVALIDRTIGQETKVSDEMRGRIFEAGIKWGVESNQIEILVQNRIDANQPELKAATPWLKKSFAALLSLLMLGGIAWLGWRVIQFAGQPSAKKDVEAVVDKTERPVEEPPIVDPTWWSKRTKDLFGAFSSNTRFAVFPHDLLRAPDPRQRVEGYRRLIEALISAEAEEASAAQTMFGLMFAEEDDSTRLEIAECLLQTLQVFRGNLPNNLKSWKENWRVLDLLLACKTQTLNSRDLSGLDDVAVELTGLSIREPDFANQSYPALAERHWQIIQSFSFRRPEQAAKLVDGVSDLATRRMGRSLGLEHSTAMTLLNVRPVTWTHMRSTLGYIIESSGADQLREIYLSNQKWNDPELQRWLSIRIARRLQVNTQGITAERIDKTIRASLGLQNEVANLPSKRWQPFLKNPLAKSRISQPVDLTKSPSPQAIADTVHLATIALLLSESEQRSSPQLNLAIQELLKTGPRDVSIRTTSLVPDLRSELPLYQQIERRAVPSDIRTFESALARLANPDENPKAKALAFEQMGTVANRIKRLNQNQANTIARFMLEAETTSELISVEQHATKLKHWPNLALKIADLLPNHDGDIDQAITCATLLLDLQPKLSSEDSGGSWRESLSLEMKQRIATVLRYTAERIAADKRYQWNELRGLLLDHYRIRCQAVNADPARISSGLSPDELAVLFAETWLPIYSGQPASNLKTGKLFTESEIQHLALVSETVVGALDPSLVDAQRNTERSSAIQQFYQNEQLLLRFLIEQSNPKSAVSHRGENR